MRDIPSTVCSQIIKIFSASLPVSKYAFVCAFCSVSVTVIHGMVPARSSVLHGPYLHTSHHPHPPSSLSALRLRSCSLVQALKTSHADPSSDHADSSYVAAIHRSKAWEPLGRVFYLCSFDFGGWGCGNGELPAPMTTVRSGVTLCHPCAAPHSKHPAMNSDLYLSTL